MHVGDGVLAVDGQLDAPRLAQSGVQHGAVLGGVDVHAGEHRVPVLLEAGRPREIDQQFHRLPGDSVLAVVDIEVADRQRQFGAALGVLVEKLADVFVANLIMMPRQGLPCWGGRDVRDLLLVGGHSSTLMRLNDQRCKRE